MKIGGACSRSIAVIRDCGMSKDFERRLLRSFIRSPIRVAACGASVAPAALIGLGGSLCGRALVGDLVTLRIGATLLR